MPSSITLFDITDPNPQPTNYMVYWGIEEMPRRGTTLTITHPDTPYDGSLHHLFAGQEVVVIDRPIFHWEGLPPYYVQFSDMTAGLHAYRLRRLYFGLGGGHDGIIQLISQLELDESLVNRVDPLLAHLTRARLRLKLRDWYLATGAEQPRWLGQYIMNDPAIRK